jgi:hypothetical protein
MKQFSSFKLLASLGVALSLVACGGGDDAPSGLTLTGTAATGMALAGANVSAKCAQGTGSTVTAADGSYKVLLPTGSLPCVLQVTRVADGLKLHSVAVGSGSSVVANLTPLSNMLTVRLARGDAAGYFGRFDAALGKQVSSDSVKAAQADISTLLSSTLDTRSLSDFVSVPLKAATPSAPTGGDAQDKLLDALQAKLSAARHAQMLAVLATGKAADPAAAYTPWITVETATLSVPARTTRALLASINYPKNAVPVRQPVSWVVVEADGGRVDAISGIYEAPAKAGTYHVRATRGDAPTVSATVTITVPAPAYDVLDTGPTSGVEKAQTQVIRDASAWAALWASHKPALPGNAAVAAPLIDFKTSMVVGVFAGTRADACSAVAIVSTQQTTAKLLVQYRDSVPTGVSSCATVISAPADLVKVPRSETPVEFVLVN